VEGASPVWTVPLASDREPNPLYRYVVNFVRLHECGFTTPASRFVRGLCYHYGVELHNFAPNAISQAATFIGFCEGFPGDLSEVGTLSPLAPRGAAHPRHRQGAGASGGACRWPDVRIEGDALGAVPAEGPIRRPERGE
jgi:hypothetical protein